MTFFKENPGKITGFLLLLLLLIGIGCGVYFAPALFGVELVGSIVNMQMFITAASVVGSALLVLPLIFGFIAKKIGDWFRAKKNPGFSGGPGSKNLSATINVTPGELEAGVGNTASIIPKLSAFASRVARWLGIDLVKFAALETANASLQTQLVASQKSATQLQTQLSASQQSASQLQTQLTASQQRASQLQTQLAAATSQNVQGANAEVEELRAKLAAANKQVEEVERRSKQDSDRRNAELDKVQKELTQIKSELSSAQTIGATVQAQLLAQSTQARASSSSQSSSHAAVAVQPARLRSADTMTKDDWKLLKTLFDESQPSNFVNLRSLITDTFTQQCNADYADVAKRVAVISQRFARLLSQVSEKNLLNLDKGVRVSVDFLGASERSYMLNEFIEEMKVKFVVLQKLAVNPQLRPLFQALQKNPEAISVTDLNQRFYNENVLSNEQSAAIDQVMNTLGLIRRYLADIRVAHQAVAAQKNEESMKKRSGVATQKTQEDERLDKQIKQNQSIGIKLMHETSISLFHEVKDLLSNSLSAVERLILVPVIDRHGMPHSLQSYCAVVLAELSIYDNDLKKDLSKFELKPQSELNLGHIETPTHEAVAASATQVTVADLLPQETITQSVDLAPLTTSTGFAYLSQLPITPGGQPPRISVTEMTKLGGGMSDPLGQAAGGNRGHRSDYSRITEGTGAAGAATTCALSTSDSLSTTTTTTVASTTSSAPPPKPAVTDFLALAIIKRRAGINDEPTDAAANRDSAGHKEAAAPIPN